MTHHPNHLCEHMGQNGKTSGVVGSCSVATKHNETSIRDWRDGWLWITQSFFHEAIRSLCLDMLSPATVVKHLWEKNLRVERVPLMASTDRGYTSSILWEQQFIKDVMKHSCQKEIKESLNAVMLQKYTLTKFTTKKMKQLLLNCWQSHIWDIKHCCSKLHYAGGSETSDVTSWISKSADRARTRCYICDK